MRKLWLFAIAIISFLAIVSQSLLQKAVAISLFQRSWYNNPKDGY